jgi:hypothetical protein
METTVLGVVFQTLVFLRLVPQTKAQNGEFNPIHREQQAIFRLFLQHVYPTQIQSTST